MFAESRSEFRLVAILGLFSLMGCQPQVTSPTSKESVASKTVQEAKSDSGKTSDQRLDTQGQTIQEHTGSGPVIELEPASPPSSDGNLSVEASGAAVTLELTDNEPAALDAPKTQDETQQQAITTANSTGVGEPATAQPTTAEPNTAQGLTPAQVASTSTTAAVPVIPATSSPDSSEKLKPTFSNVATEAERNQKIAADWPKPQLVIYVSGQQQGYIEPCGCTGLDSQKGGLIRRDTLLTELRGRGWDVIPVDVGNQNREKRASGPQPQIKFDTTAKALQMMDYRAVGLGVQDLELSRVDLIQAAGSAEGTPRPFISANVTVYSQPDLFPAYRIVEASGRKIGITSVIGEELEKKVIKDPNDDEISFANPTESLKQVVPELKEKGCDFIVLLAHTSLEESESLAQAVDGIDLVVTAGGFGEPTLNAEPIQGSKAVMVQVGTKGMYGGIVGLFDDPQQPIRYQKIAISSQFKDSERMLQLFAEYQDRLKETGFKGLGLSAAVHPSGRQFVGSESCGECHTQAFDIWKETPHYHATDSIVAANNDRGGIARHFDPECVSCHVTGWEPQRFTPFQSGYESLELSSHLLGSGCENCHGPGSAHVAAENGDLDVTPAQLEELRQEMVLPLAKAEAKCMECHDMDNSPDFHAEGAFEKYWEQVKHYGKN